MRSPASCPLPLTVYICVGLNASKACARTATVDVAVEQLRGVIRTRSEGLVVLTTTTPEFPRYPISAGPDSASVMDGAAESAVIHDCASLLDNGAGATR